MAEKKVIILGAGLAGLSTAYFLKKEGIKVLLFEKEKTCGGLCRSYTIDGFTFDISGHLLHFRDKRLLSLVKAILAGNLVEHRRKAYVYTFNRMIPYPFQLNFHYLPEGVAKKCFSDFIEVNNDSTDIEGNNFLEWSYNSFGKAITDYFMKPYNRKFWRIPLKKLNYKEVDRFIVIPTIGDIKNSIAGRNHKSFGYSSRFWYPKRGGIEKLTEGLSKDLKSIDVNSEVVEINLKKKMIKLKSGAKKEFNRLVSTLPLPELKRIIKDLPSGIKKEFDKLKWLSVININLSVDRQIQPKCHWIYFPDSDIPFFRVGFFHNFSSSLAPYHKGSLYVEASYSGDNLPDKTKIVRATKRYLKKTNIIDDEDKIIQRKIDDIKYAYPVCDMNYNRSRFRILEFLSKKGIITCGRFGSWGYMSMEDVIAESEKVSKILYEQF